MHVATLVTMLLLTKIKKLLTATVIMTSLLKKMQAAALTIMWLLMKVQKATLVVKILLLTKRTVTMLTTGTSSALLSGRLRMSQLSQDSLNTLFIAAPVSQPCI